MAEIKHHYIFPDFLAKAMSKVDMRTQLEATMLSLSFMMVGLILSVIYGVLYFDLRLWFKIVLIINGFFGIIFMWSFILTTYHQYQNYMEAQGIQDEIESLSKLKIEDVRDIFEENEMKGGNENA